MVEIILCTVTRCLPQKMFTHTPTSTPMVSVYFPATPTFPARLNGISEDHNLHERRPRSPTRRRHPLLRCGQPTGSAGSTGCRREALQGPQGEALQPGVRLWHQSSLPQGLLHWHVYHVLHHPHGICVLKRLQLLLKDIARHDEPHPVEPHLIRQHVRLRLPQGHKR